MKNKVLHASVGFGIYDYSINSLDAILKNKNYSNEIALITTGIPKRFGFKKKVFFDTYSDDFKKINEYVKKKKKKDKFLFKLINKQRPNLKTGLLYEGYNFLLNYCIKNKIRFLNIIQNDMQMLWWDDKILQLSLEIFNKFDDCLSLTNTFSRAKYDRNIYLNKQPHKDLFSKSQKKKFRLFDLNSSYSDCGIFDVKKLEKIKFKFEGTTHDNCEKYYNLGYRLYNHPWPCAAAIPWPAVARKGKIIGKVFNYEKELAMSFKKGANHKLIMKSKSRIFYHEDWVHSTFDYCLEPTWVTELDVFDYLSNLLKSYSVFGKKMKIRYTKFGKKNKNFFYFFLPNSYPNIWMLIYDKTIYLSLRVIKKLFKL